MKKFNYKARDKNDRRVKGIIDALNRNEALLSLRGRKFRDIHLSELVEKKKSSLNIVITWGPFGRVSEQEILIFSKKIATMVRSGLTILDALILVKDQTENLVFKNAVAQIINNINQGNSLSSSLKIYPRYFDEAYINMVEAGELSGKLDTFLDRIVEGQERMQKIRAGIKSALFYPITLVVVTVLILFFMMIKVVPMFAQMYSSAGKKLPAPTQMMIDASNWLLSGSHIFQLLGIIILISTIHSLAYKYIYIYRRFYSWLFLKLPIFGNIVVKSTVARLSLLMANLFAAGINVSDILKVGTRITPNIIFMEAMTRISDRIVSGVDLSTLFADEPAFPQELSQLIKVGEKTGNMDEMLTSIARYYQEEFESVVEGLTSMIEPLMIVFVGGVIGAMVVALYLPIFSAGDAIS